jgi:hypothetical protein
MTAGEGAMLMMQSLKRGQPVDDVTASKTSTYYNRKHLPKSIAVPCGFWFPADRRVDFEGNVPGHMDGNLRCRPSVKVMEFPGVVNGKTEAAKERIKLQNSIISIIAKQYESRIATLNSFGLLDATIPAVGVEWGKMRKLIDNLTTGQMKEILRFKDPMLLIIPRGTVDKKIEAINAHKKDPVTDQDAIVEGYKEPELSNFGVVIVERSNDIMGGENVIGDIIKNYKLSGPAGHSWLDLSLPEQRIQIMEGLKKRGLALIDQHQFLMMAMELIASGGSSLNPEGIMSALSGGSSSDDTFPIATWSADGGCPVLSFYQDEQEPMHLRPCVKLT